MTCESIVWWYPRAPNKEIVWNTIYTSGQIFVVTSNRVRDKYYLYKCAKDGVLSKRIASSATPEYFNSIIYKE